MARPVCDWETDAPYTATMVMTVEVVDPKTGAVKKLNTRTLQARDAAGRTRTRRVARLDRRPSGAGGRWR